MSRAYARACIRQALTDLAIAAELPEYPRAQLECVARANAALDSAERAITKAVAGASTKEAA